MFGGFKTSKLKPQLRMAVSRLQMVSNKKSAQMKNETRLIASLLSSSPPKEEKAKIRAEALIRDDDAIEAYEILQLGCELLAERVKLIGSERDCPKDLLGCVATLLWAESRVDITELTEIKRLFRSKYGKTFVETALSDEGGICNARVVTKLSVSPPSAYLVQIYLEKIAEQFGIDWEPTIKLDAGDMLRPTAAPTGYSIVVAPGSGLAPAAGEVTIMGSHDSDAAPAAGVVPSTVIPQAPYIPPYVPPSTCEKLEEEVDIIVTPFVPTCTTASIMEENSNGSGDSLLPTETGQNESGGDMDKKRGDDAPLSTFSMDSYDALKARFDQLKQK